MDLKETLSQLLRANQQLSSENTVLKKSLLERYAFSQIIGTSRAIKEVLSKAQKVADTTFNVLITGETGTGKKTFAKAIH